LAAISFRETSDFRALRRHFLPRRRFRFTRTESSGSWTLDRCAFGWSRFGSFSTAGATPFVDPVWVFLVRTVSLRKPPIMRVGFPWISLDSLVRIETLQWVTRDFQQKFFRALLSSRKGCRNGAPRFGMRKRWIVHGGDLSLISDFLQEIVGLL
jgi:hypothetical protein